MQGDVVFFNQFLLDAFKAKHNFEKGAFCVGLTVGKTEPSADTEDPRWGPDGETNFKAEECSPGGSYVVDGKPLANPSVDLSDGLVCFHLDDPSFWLLDEKNPTNAKWGIIYNKQATKECVGYIDIGGTFNMSSGDLGIKLGDPIAKLGRKV